MISKKFIVTAKYGLHARPATKLVGQATTFKSEVHIKFEDKKINLKSIMGLLSLSIPNGSEIVLTVDGKNEENEMDSLVSFITLENIGQLV